MIKRLLIINRGEIACRIIQACRELSITPIVLYTEDDDTARHVRLSEEAHLVNNYLDQDFIIQLAINHRVDAIHPGYGFLSENAEFAKKVEKNNLIWIGPSWKSMQILGEKISSKLIAKKAGVPTLAYTPASEAIKNISKLKFPLILKSSLGGGGRGMRIVSNQNQFQTQLDSATRESLNAFGKAEIYIETFLPDAKHIEVQIIADQKGSTLHLGERDCSTQRRHQKLMEESPAPGLNSLKNKLCEAAVKIAKAANYTNAGTVEFLVKDNAFFFLEMNTRLQVEHPVTEWVTGLDLVKMQIEIADGKKLTIDQNNIQSRGHSIEVRIVAENPSHNFLPSSGKLLYAEFPKGIGIRVETGYETGDEISDKFDSLVLKIIVHASDRAHATDRLIYALKNTILLGIETNIEYLISLLKSSDWRQGKISIRYLEEIFKYNNEELGKDVKNEFELILQENRSSSQEIKNPWDYIKTP